MGPLVISEITNNAIKTIKDIHKLHKNVLVVTLKVVHMPQNSLVTPCWTGAESK